MPNRSGGRIGLPDGGRTTVAWRRWLKIGDFGFRLA